MRSCPGRSVNDTVVLTCFNGVVCFISNSSCCVLSAGGAWLYANIDFVGKPFSQFMNAPQIWSSHSCRSPSAASRVLCRTRGSRPPPPFRFRITISLVRFTATYSNSHVETLQLTLFCVYVEARLSARRRPTASNNSTYTWLGVGCNRYIIRPSSHPCSAQDDRYSSHI